MDESDKKYVGEQIRQLCGVHRVKPDTDLQAGYWVALKDMTRAQFDAALAHVQKHALWMPKPAEFRAALRRGWM
jgi:hypothetical protein